MHYKFRRKHNIRNKLLELMRLDGRRFRSDLIETFQITKGMYDVNKVLSFKIDDSGKRGHDKKLFEKRWKKNCDPPDSTRPDNS